MNYVYFFDQIRKEIIANPHLELVEFNVGEPLPKKEIERLLHRFNNKIDPNLLKFYNQVNGIDLTWRPKTDLSDDDFNNFANENSDIPIEREYIDENPFARINILSLGKILEKDFSSYAYEGYIHIDSETKTREEIGRNMFAFDVFSDFDCIAIYFHDKPPYTFFLMLSNYYDDWISTRLTDFESYIKLIASTRGICELKRNYFSDFEGISKPLKIIQAEEQISLTPLLFQ